MNAVIGYASLACVAAGLLAGLTALAVTRDGRAALRVALDLWLAAGLLRLALPPSWDQLLSAAAIVAVRQLVGLGMSAGGARTPATGD
ncbi:DUF1622 domain-containing protein [Micromonospora siamensis]|uniref:DUF1622 domain-containing protein n=1 Tax=Micromonospora siamensis TaxID=299152 RepID=A0A1C5I6K2_9ACTN|nr:DUF1622 domain-containing protein [Micromonospora siamensis]SCG53914.1 Protein of unknown function [Micromonospora siamensis]